MRTLWKWCAASHAPRHWHGQPWRGFSFCSTLVAIPAKCSQSRGHITNVHLMIVITHRRRRAAATARAWGRSCSAWPRAARPRACWTTRTMRWQVPNQARPPLRRPLSDCAQRHSSDSSRSLTRRRRRRPSRRRRACSMRRTLTMTMTGRPCPAHGTVRAHALSCLSAV